MTNNGAGHGDTTNFDLAQDALHSILHGDDPSEVSPSALGEYEEPIKKLLNIRRNKGVEEARQTFQAMAEADSSLYDLAAGDTPSWRWNTLSDALEPKEPREWLIDDMVPIPSVILPYGAPGSLKTMVLQDLSLCVAAGKNWLPELDDVSDEHWEPKEVQKNPVLWVDEDNGKDRFERRIAALARGHEIGPGDAELNYVSFPNPPFTAGERESEGRIIQAANQMGAQMICFDNLNAVSGGTDENAAGEMGPVLKSFRRVAEATGAAVFVIHHARKSDNSIRGSTGIKGALDLALLIDREEGSDSITLRSKKTRDLPFKPFQAMWTYEQKPDGELEAGEFYGLGRPDQNLTAADAARKQILGNWTDGRNQSAIVEDVTEAVDVGKGSVLTALNELEQEGVIEAHTKGPGYPKTYRKP